MNDEGSNQKGMEVMFVCYEITFLCEIFLTEPNEVH